MGVYPDHVQSRLGGQGDVGAHLFGGGITECGPRRSQVGSLQEETFAVDVQDPVVEPQRPQAHPPDAPVRHLPPAPRGPCLLAGVPGVDRELQVMQGGGVGRGGGGLLGGQGPGPPQVGICDRQRPLDAVLPGGQRAALDVLVAPDACHELGDAGRRSVQNRADEHGGVPHVGGRAQHPQVADPDGSRALQADRPPQAPWVPVRVDAVPVLENAGQVPFGGPVHLRGTGDLRGQDVLAGRPQRVGDLELVREEVALGVPQI